jgi:hypothetical protein
MDFEPDELRLLQENVRRFVDRELIPLERAVVNDEDAEGAADACAARPRRSGCGLRRLGRIRRAGTGMAAKIIV